MQMTEGEILSSYRQAKEKGKQVKILAELNAVPQSTITDILTKHGYLKNGKPRKGPMPKSVINAPAPEKEEKPKAEKSLRIKAVRIVPKAEKPVFPPVEGMFVTRNVRNIMNQKLFDMKENINRLKIEHDKLGRDIARSQADYDDFFDFVMKTVVKEGNDGEE